MKKRALMRSLIAAGLLSTAAGAGYVYHLWQQEGRRTALVRACSPIQPDVIAGCTAWIAAEPANPSPYSTRASAYARQGDFRRALNDYDSALRLKPTSSHDFYMRGRVHADMKSFRLAIADFSKALDSKPSAKSVSFVHRARAQALEALGDLNGAIRDYTEAHRLDPAMLSAIEGRGRLYLRLEDYDKAISDFDLLLREHSGSAQLHFQRGNAHSGKMRFASAIADFDRAISIAPRFTAAYLSRAAAYLRLDNKPKAIADFRVAVALDPTFTPAVDELKRLERETAK